MQGEFYPRVFNAAGISLVVPQPDEQTYIHDKYMGELVKGIIRPETRQRLLAIVDRLKERESIDGVILGGTELPLILGDVTDRAIPFLDTTADSRASHRHTGVVVVELDLVTTQMRFHPLWLDRMKCPDGFIPCQ